MPATFTAELIETGRLSRTAWRLKPALARGIAGPAHWRRFNVTVMFVPKKGINHVNAYLAPTVNMPLVTIPSFRLKGTRALSL